MTHAFPGGAPAAPSALDVTAVPATALAANSQQAAQDAAAVLQAGKVKRRMKLTEFREQYFEGKGADPVIELEADNGEVFVVAHPLMLDDAATERLAAVNRGDDLDKDQFGEVKVPPTVGGNPAPSDQVRVARAVLGDDIHARFVAAGGHSNDIAMVFNQLQEALEEGPKSS